jgi:cell pole-organizing protein PopZ
MLRDWLNSNLPAMVESAVAREMERVRARIG